jgi:hypothetical protein
MVTQSKKQTEKAASGKEKEPKATKKSTTAQDKKDSSNKGKGPKGENL